MSYGVSSALQTAVFQRLSGDAVLAGLVNGAIYDALPSGTLPPLYVSLGPETAKDKSDQTGQGAEHEFIISVVTDVSGFQAAKTVAAAVSDALVDADLSLARGRLVSLNFARAAAKREGTGTVRRIDLKFRARVEDI
jgi:hypothetical protein